MRAINVPFSGILRTSSEKESAAAEIGEDFLVKIEFQPSRELS